MQTTPPAFMPARTDDSDASEADDEDIEVDGTIKRVNISMRTDRHKKLQKFADKNGTTFSALARHGAELLRSRAQEDNTSRELQPLYRKIEQIVDSVTELDTKVDQSTAEVSQLLEQFDGEADETTNGRQPKQVGDEIFEVLLENGPSTIPELMEVLDVDRRTVQVAINHLRDTHAIVEGDGDGVTRWEVR